VTLSDVLVASLLVVLAVLPLFFLWRTWLQVDRDRGDPLLAVLFTFAAGNALIYLLVPAVLRMTLGWASDRRLNVLPVEIVEVYVIEVVSVFVWTLVLRAFRNWPKTENATKAATAGLTHRIFLGTLLICAMWLNVDSILHGAALVEAGVTGGSTVLSDRILWPLSPICQFAGTVVGCYVTVRGPRACGKILWWLGLCGIGVYSVSYGMQGVRGALVWPAMWTVVLLRMYQRRYWLFAGIPAVAIIGAVAIFQGSYLSLRETMNKESLSERVKGLEQGTSSPNTDVIFTAEERLGCASRYAVAFVRMWDRGDGAYLKPIVNSLYAPLPRVFFPDKPWPTSRDGDQYTSGMYLIVTELTHHENYSMTEFLTGAHAYWEYGWVGVVALSALAALYAMAATGVARQLGFAGPPMLVFFFKPWGYNTPKLWISDAIIELTQIIPAIAAVWITARVLAKIIASLDPSEQIIPRPSE
jgi:hypothetical protein